MAARLHELVRPHVSEQGQARSEPVNYPVSFSYASIKTQIFLHLVPAGFVAGSVMLLAATIAGNGPPIAFVILWFAVAAWLVCWFVLRIAYRLDVENGQLRWKLPFGRGGTVLVSDVVKFRQSKADVMGSMELIELRDHRPVLVFAHRGLRDFANALGMVREVAAAKAALTSPSSGSEPLPIDIGFQGLLSERVGVFSWFEVSRTSDGLP